MIPFTYDIAQTLTNKSRADIIYFDFAKAFDSVSHDLIPKNWNMIIKLMGWCSDLSRHTSRGGNSNLKLEVLPLKLFQLRQEYLRAKF